MSISRNIWSSVSAAARRAVWLLLLVGCAAEPLGENAEPAPRRHYRPGESIADARVCACEECVKAACCSADDEPLSSTTELGLTVPTCGGCYRRVWTVRGDRSCDESRPVECCQHG